MTCRCVHPCQTRGRLLSTPLHVSIDGIGGPGAGDACSGCSDGALPDFALTTGLDVAVVPAHRAHRKLTLNVVVKITI